MEAKRTNKRSAGAGDDDLDSTAPDRTASSPTMVPVKVGCFTRYVPHYRHGVFELIHRQSGIDFTVAAGKVAADETIYCPETHGFRFRETSYRRVRLPNGKNQITFCPHVLSALVRGEFDVIILSNDILGVDVWLSAILRRWFGVGLVLWGQGISRPETRVRVWLRRQLMRRSDACVFYGEAERQTWIDRGFAGERLFVAYNALDTDVQTHLRNQLGAGRLQEFKRQAGLDGKRVFAFSGRLVRDKDPAFAARGLSEVVKRVPDAHLVVIGDGPERVHLEELILRSGLRQNCTLVGAIFEETAIAPFLLSSRAVVIPRAAGLTVQHAFGYGVPVILPAGDPTHGPEARLVVNNETGLHFQLGDVHGLADAIVRLLTDDDLFGRLSTNAAAVIAKRHNKQRMAEGIVMAVRHAMGTGTERTRTGPYESAS